MKSLDRTAVISGAFLRRTLEVSTRRIVHSFEPHTQEIGDFIRRGTDFETPLL